MPGFGELRKIESEYNQPAKWWQVGKKFQQWRAKQALQVALDRAKRVREQEEARKTDIAKAAALSQAVREGSERALLEATRAAARIAREAREGVIDPLTRAYRSSDPRLRRAVETIASPVKTAASPIVKAVGFVLKQTSRPWAGIKTAKAGERFLKGFLHPEQAPEYIIKPEEWKLKGLTPEDRRRMSAFVEFLGGMATDPITYIGVGVVGKGAVKGVEAALKTGERLSKLEDAAQRAARLAEVAKGTTKAGKVIKNVDKAARQLDTVVKRWEKAAKLQEKFKTIPLDDVVRRGKATSQIIRARASAKKAEAELVDTLRKHIGELSLQPGLRRVEAARLQTMLDLSTGGTADRLRRLGDVLADLQKSVRNVAGAPGRAEQLSQLARDIALKQRQLSKLGEYYLKLGPVPLVSIEPAIKAGRAIGSRIAVTPGVSRLRNLLVGVFKPTSAKVRTGVTPTGLRRESAVVRELHRRLRQAGAKGVIAGEKALTESGLLELPKQARELASVFRESIGKGVGSAYRQREAALNERDLAKYRRLQGGIRDIERTNVREFLGKVDPELRQQVVQADRLYRASMNEITNELVNAFSSGFERILLENYVTHIVQGKPEEVRKFLDEWSAKLPTLGAQATAPATAPLGKGYFMYRRAVPTIEELEEAGLKPVKDVNLLQAAYRATAVKMLEQKRITDWLEREGFIVRDHVPKGWVPNNTGRGKVISWLPDNAGIHPEVARAFESLQPLIKGNIEEVKALLRAWDAATSFFKGLATSMRPAFHLVNQMGNNILLRMAGISYSEQTRRYPEAIRILLSNKPGDRKLVELFREHGLEGQGMFSDVVRAPQEIVKHLENYLQRTAHGKLGKIAAVAWPKHGIPIMSMGQYVGEMVDSVARMVAFKHFLDKGLSPQEAASLVKRYLFDYSMLTPTERYIRRFFMPFYTWTRYSLPRSILALIEQPGAYTGFYRLQQELAKTNEVDLNDLPPWLQASALIIGKTPDGAVIYLNAQPPWGQLFGWMVSDELTGEPQVGRDIAHSLHPALSAIFNLTAGVEPTTGKRIVESPLEPHPWLKRLSAALEKFVPQIGEFKKLYPSGKASTVGRLVHGIGGYPLTFISTYDVPLAKANELKKAEDVLDEAIRKAKEEGYQVPETRDVQQQIKRYDAGEVAKRVLADPIRRELMILIVGRNNVQKNPALLLAFAMANGDLFDGSGKEVKQKLKRLFNRENAEFLREYLGREPKLRDFIEHRTLLESPDRKATTPAERKAERFMRDVRDITEATPSRAGSITVSPSGTGNTTDVLTALVQAMRITGVDSSWLPYLRWLVQRESSGDPRAVNPVPVNGEHATGLLQTLPSTFRQYALPGYGNIYDPLHNAIAAIRYIQARYGHPSRIPNIGNWTAFTGY